MNKILKRGPTFPIGESLQWHHLDDDPYPVFDRLRASEPVSWAPHLNMWLVTRRVDILAVLSDSATFRTDAAGSLIRAHFGIQMLSAEGARHARYKSNCFPPFRPDVLQERMRPRLRLLAASLLDKLSGAELRAGFANPMAVGAISTLLGIPMEAQALLGECYTALSAALANFSGDAEIRGAGGAAAQTTRDLLKHCLANPIDDAWSLLATLRDGASGMTEEEIVSNCLVILFGGIETTEAAILNAVWALLTHPEQAGLLRRDPALLAPAIEESLRWESAVQSCTRHVQHRTQVGGVVVQKGDTVQCLVGAANRDPEFFADPAIYDIRRPNASQHLTFGYGRHFCLGAALARMNVAVSLSTLFERFPRIALDHARSTRPRGYEFRKPDRLTLALTASA